MLLTLAVVARKVLCSSAIMAEPIRPRNVLAFACSGSKSHQMISLRIGQELVARGHRCSILISDADELSKSILEGAQGVRLLTFKGPPFYCTEEWAATLPQDPQEVVITC